MKLNYLGTRHWMVSSVGVDVGWFEKGEEVWERKQKGGRGEKGQRKKPFVMLALLHLGSIW